MERQSAPQQSQPGPGRTSKANVRKELAEGNDTKPASLTDYFKASGSQEPIRQWASSFAEKNVASFCELLSTVLELAGKRIDVTAALFEGDSYEAVLCDFEEKRMDETNEAPYVLLMKDKHKSFEGFWKKIAEAMVSCNALFSPLFGSFREWMIQFSMCKIRAIRCVTTVALFELLRALVAVVARDAAEIERMKGIGSNDSVNTQIEALEREQKIYVSVARSIEQNVAIVRTRDVDSQIRAMPIFVLTDAAVAYPPEFADVQKLKYVGMALNDTVPKTRRDALRCFERIIREIDNEELGKELSERFAERIVEMTDDKDNAVVASALDCLLAMSEKGILDDVECSHTTELLCDDSQAIRASAAKFVVRHYFNTPDKSTLANFVKYAEQMKDDDQELAGAVASLYSHVKCLRKWEEICDALRDENDDSKAKILAKILLYSCERTTGKLFNIPAESEKKLRKMTSALVKSLSKLIKGFQADKDTVIALVGAGRLVNLDAISESSLDHLYQQLLAEIRDLFIRSSDRSVFTTAISTLYQLTLSHHQLSELAKKELNRLAVECAKIEGSDDDLIAKFVAAARLVDVSDGGTIRDRIIGQMEKSTDDTFIADCLEGLQYFFRWDIHQIRRDPAKRDEYVETFNKYLNLFSERLQCENKAIQREAFRALGCVMALSPFMRQEQQMFSNELVDKFYSVFHSLENKRDIFDVAQKPIQTHAIDLSYAVHLLVYYGNEKLQPYTKLLWKELMPYKPIGGSQTVTAFQQADVDEAEMKISARFLAGKVISMEVLRSWFDEENDEILSAILPFFLMITPEQAASLIPIASDRFEPLLRKISDGEKTTQKMFSSLLQGRSTTKVRRQPVREDPVDEHHSASDVEFEEPGESFVTTRH